MASIQRLRAVWTGFPGSPGLSNFYFTDAAASQGNLRAFFFAISGFLPPDVTVSVNPGGDVLDDATGTLTSVWAGTLQDPVVGSGPTEYAAPVGFLARWETLTIRSGSRLRGRTYLVPASSLTFNGTDGSIGELNLANIRAACFDFVGAVTPNMLVWQRPRAARAAYVDGYGKPVKALASRVGSSAVVTSSSVPDMAVVLRSRRDS